MPTTRAAKAAHQLTQLLDDQPTHPTQHLAARLVTTAHLLWTVGHLATTRAAEHAPGIRAANGDPHRGHGGDPTATTAERNLEHGPDPTATLNRDLDDAIRRLDRARAHLDQLIAQAVTVHRRDQRPTAACAEALCTEAATPGRLGYCETDYRRRLRWAEANTDQHPPDWDSETHETPKALTKAERLGIHQAPALTHEQLADRAIRKRRKTA